MEVEIQYRGAARFDVSSRAHQLISDQPSSNGGEDAGMTPPELLLASLGTCAGFYGAQYLRTRSLPTEPFSIKLTAEKLLHPARVGAIRLDVSAPALAPEHQTGLLRAMKACLIHNTLLHPPEIAMELNTADQPLLSALK
jgi:uncharacterized OsmC-like protein